MKASTSPLWAALTTEQRRLIASGAITIRPTGDGRVAARSHAGVRIALTPRQAIEMLP